MQQKIIEMTPEWILVNLSNLQHVEKIMIVTAISDTEADLIRLALETLDISFVEYDCSDYDTCNFSFEFRYEDIKIDCPSLYDNAKCELRVQPNSLSN